MSASPPQPHARGWYDADDAPGTRDLNTCIHCGLCLTACPTYRELKIEPDSPRGRLYLMRGLAEGRIEPGDDLVHHLDLCLGCRACETVCPAGVPYGRLLEETRGQLERRRPHGGPARGLGRIALDTLFPNRGLMHWAASMLRLGQSGGPLAGLVNAVMRRGWLPGFAARGLELTPPLLPRDERRLERIERELPRGARLERTNAALVLHPAGAPRARVAFFTSCVMDVMFPRINQDAVRLLVLAGAEVVVPHAQTCCGALHAHSGLRHTAKRLAQRNVTAFGAGEQFDYIVSDSAGCGAALRDFVHLLGETPQAAAAGAFASRVRDVSEVLATLGLPAPTGSLTRDVNTPLRVAYHDPCHLAHAQRVRAEPRSLLRDLPGAHFVELPNSDWCCGSAGVYNLTHPAMADAQLDNKLQSIASIDADVVVASNPGCLLHMERGARARGSHARMVHIVELLALAHPPPRPS